MDRRRFFIGDRDRSRRQERRLSRWRAGPPVSRRRLAGRGRTRRSDPPERHVEALVDAGGITLFSTAETTHDGDTEPSPWLPSQEYESAYDLENGRQYVRQELTETEETDVSELYVADGEALVRQRIGDETQYGRQSVDRPVAADDLESAMRSGS